MNILILAAGYATRLYPLTQTKAKPLLEVAGKPMMEWVIDNLAPIEGIEKVFVVTNSKFAADFQAWADDYVARGAKLVFEIVNDGSTSDFCRAKNQPVLGVYDVGSLEQAKKYGVVAIDGEGTITEFVEKPAEPKSTFIGIALYYYPAAVVGRIGEYIAAGNNPDQPGRFIQWLYPQVPVQTWSVPGTWFDVGSKETLLEANEIFAQFAK
jgi:glucose-1-phosphate thymidylyltransferase